ncbi:MAG: hypothetical protein ACXAC8_13385 [Candidatus Hodarchaeales archaeon]
MTRWFGSSGIRGPFSHISPKFSMKLGMAVGKVFETDLISYISSDVRFTSDLLKSSFISGYSYVSGTIIDIGLCPTPVLSHISSVQNTLGVMVTASHNPPSNNGFKFFYEGGECGRIFEEQVEKQLNIELNRLTTKKPSLKSWKEVGTARYGHSEQYFEQYVSYLLKKISIKNLDLTIVLDCANNVPNLVSPAILRQIGFSKVITINESLDATFHGRPSEPTSENLYLLKKSVIKEKADIGIAHDGDGDRFALIDEKGTFVNSTTIINFLIDCLDYTNPKQRKIILTSDCTNQAFEIAQKKGAEVVTSLIGRNRDFVNDDQVLFLAEPNKILFPDIGKWIDGIFPVLKVLEKLESKTVSMILSPYDKRKILRRAFKISEEEKYRTEKMIEDLPDLWSEKISKVSFFDGLKLFFADNSSVLIRFSGTEPKIKFYVESQSEKKNENILTRLKDIFDIRHIGTEC